MFDQSPAPAKIMHPRPRPKSCPRSTTANQLFKNELKTEGLDPKCYGLHSLRSGGATTAAAMGIPDRLLQRQGGWRSARAKNNYIDKSVNSLLLVTKYMQSA